MSAGAVISLYSTHAQNIYSGVKRFEYRTRRPARDVGYLAIYETGETHAVTGIAKVSGIIEGAPSEIWKLTKTFAGITSQYFKGYFSGKKKAVAYCISEAVSFDRSVPLSEIGVERPPQSFQYISEEAVAKLLKRSSASESKAGFRYFIGGVHVVGKTTFAKGIAAEMGIDHYSSNDLIRLTRSLDDSGKSVADQDVNRNQLSLADGLRHTSWFEAGGLLDGHFVLRSEEGRFLNVPSEVFRQMRLDSLFVLTGNPRTIAEQAEARDGLRCEVWQRDTAAIEEMQKAEVSRAKAVARELKMPLSVIKSQRGAS